MRSPREEQVLMAREVREGLLSDPPAIPSKYFYDARGGLLFDRITTLPEYYLTRAEAEILEATVDDMVAGAGARELFELGSGLGVKTRTLLDAIARGRRGPRSCVLLDVDEAALRRSLAGLAAADPALRARGIVGDFLRDLPRVGGGGGRLMALLGSTIGNLHPARVPGFFADAARALATGDAFLVGLDLVKDTRRLEAAYNDAEGVTAEFNRNALRVVNARLGADFEPEAFAHLAFYDRANDWIEMRLRAVRATAVTIPRAAVSRRFARGDEIRTELSCKFTRPRLAGMLPGTGLALERWETDARGDFALALLRRA
jgi:L-histidine N-alpha-methyltransferase